MDTRQSDVCVVTIVMILLQIFQILGHTMLGGHEVGAIEAECEEVATRAAAAAPKLPRSRLTRDTRAAAATIKLIKRGGGRRHMRRQIAENRRVSAAVFGELISSAHTAAASPGLLGDLGTHSHIPAGSCGCCGRAGTMCGIRRLVWRGHHHCSVLVKIFRFNYE